MNIANALKVALPELPERAIQRSIPKLDPRVIAKQQIEGGKPTVLAKLPGADNFIRFEPVQWVLLQSFDGERSYLEIAERVAAETGVLYSEDDVREFAAFIQQNTDLFYKSALEKNILLQQKLRGQRLKRGRIRVGDFSDITIAEWPHADAFITRIYPHLRWIYTWWFTLLALGMFAVMAWMWADRFGQIWRDSFEFYNFTTKTGRDLLEFWVLFGAMAFLHESFHGLTCKHFGGGVEKMGFSLMYFAPSFFCDVTQIWIYGGKWERIATVIAGIWGDLIVCFVGTVIWWTTVPGMVAHAWAYKVMMVTGIGVSLLNLNPLIKLDGYYIFCELIEEPDFKERTSAYLSGWTRKHLFGMPAEIEYVPRRKRAFYLVYALLSAAYGYVLLSFLMVFTFNILHAYSPAWAFLPAAFIGYWVFKARIHSLGRFLKLLYLDKKERVMTMLAGYRLVAFGVAVALFLFLPVWPDFEDAAFVLEPVKQALVHAEVQGRVTHVLVNEGEHVVSGQPLLELTNLNLADQAAKVRADLQVATARAIQSQLRYHDMGPSERERQRLVREDQVLMTEASKLQIVSPIAGTIATPHVRDLTGSYLEEGSPVVEVTDRSSLIARTFIPEYAMHDIHIGAPVRLHLQSRFMPLSGTLRTLSADWVPLDPSLGEKEQLSGINPPRFYAAEVLLNGDESLFPGMTGMAKIQVGRRSLAWLGWNFARELLGRRIW
jgi:putative peptide zinc metalloprotease protein